MVSLFKSAKRRQQEDEFDAFLDAVSKSLAAAQSEIRTFNSKGDLRLSQHAAVVLRNAVIYTDRTVEGVEELQRRADKVISENRLHRAIGTSLGSRLVVCGVLLLKLEGEEWLKGSLAFAYLEGMLKGFVENYRVPSWSVNYVQDIDFERYRRQLIAEEDAEESK